MGLRRGTQALGRGRLTPDALAPAAPVKLEGAFPPADAGRRGLQADEHDESCGEKREHAARRVGERSEDLGRGGERQGGRHARG